MRKSHSKNTKMRNFVKSIDLQCKCGQVFMKGTIVSSDFKLNGKSLLTILIFHSLSNHFWIEEVQRTLHNSYRP